MNGDPEAQGPTQRAWGLLDPGNLAGTEAVVPKKRVRAWNTTFLENGEHFWRNDC